MKNEKCETTMDKFMELDKNERIPLSVTLHLLCCKKCRNQVHYLTLAEKYATQPTERSFSEIFDDMEFKPVSMKKWIVWGIIMIVLMASFAIILTGKGEKNLAIIVNVIFGVLLTAYCALFVGSNLDFFIKKCK